MLCSTGNAPMSDHGHGAGLQLMNVLFQNHLCAVKKKNTKKHTKKQLNLFKYIFKPMIITFCKNKKI